MARFKAGEVEEFDMGLPKTVNTGGKKMLVFRLEEGFFATEANCPHMRLPLGKGKVLDGETLQCPFHRAKFCVKTGAVKEWACFPPGIQLLNVVRGEKALQTYPVEVEDGGVYIEV